MKTLINEFYNSLLYLKIKKILIKKKKNILKHIQDSPVTFFGASPYIVSTDRICRLPLLAVLRYDQRLLTLET